MKNQVKIGDLTVDELKSELKKRKIAQVGPKVALIKRLRKVLSDSGEDPDNYSFEDGGESDAGKEIVENSKASVTTTGAKKPEENDTSKSCTSTKTDTKKASAPKAESEQPKKEEKETKKLVDEVDTPKRTLRRSTREKSPAIQTAPSTPSKTPRAAKGKTVVNKLTALTEVDESSSKGTKQEPVSDTKPEESKDKEPPAKKEIKKVEEEESKKELAKEKKDTEKDKKDSEKEIKKDLQEEQDKPTEEKIVVNGQKDAVNEKSSDKKGEQKETDTKKALKKSVDKEKTTDNEEVADKEKTNEDIEEEEAKQAELDLDLDDMEQPDYEEELNFDCGSTFISDNDGDLDETQDDGKSKETPSKKQRKSNMDANKGETSATAGTGVSDSQEDGKDTEEDKEKIKSSDKNISEKEETRDSEKGTENKEDANPKDLWVTGLSSATKAADLKQAFLKHGKVISTKIVMNPKMPGSQCFGIVTVVSQEDAMACVKALNVTELLGRFITVKIIAKKKDKDKKDDGSKKKKDDDSKDKSDDKKEFSSPKKDSAKDGTKLMDDKDKRDRDIRRDREGGIRKRLGTHRVPIRRSPPPFVKRRQDNMRQQEMIRRREMVEMRKRAMDRRMAEEAHRQEAVRLNREREMLRMERERIEREKAELLRMERERLEREKEEIRKQHMRLEEVRRKREFGGPREDFDGRNKRQMNERHYSDRRPSPNYGGQQPYRRDERASGRFDTRDRYEGGGDRRHEGWREDGRGSGWQGDKGNNDQWTQQQGGSHDRHWNNSGGNKGRGGYGNNSGGSRGGNGPPSGYNRGGPANNMGGPSSMNPYPPPQQHNFNPYPPPKY